MVTMLIMFQFFLSFFSADGSCWRMNNLAKKTDVPGKFTYTSERKCTKAHTHIARKHIDALQHSQFKYEYSSAFT